jgi:hypothetical protein
MIVPLLKARPRIHFESQFQTDIDCLRQIAVPSGRKGAANCRNGHQSSHQAAR